MPQNLAQEEPGALGLRVVEERLRRVLFNDLPLIHKDHAVGHGLGEAHFMGHADHGHAIVGQIDHDVEDFGDHFRVQGRRRLIGEDDRGIVDDGAGGLAMHGRDRLASGGHHHIEADHQIGAAGADTGAGGSVRVSRQAHVAHHGAVLLADTGLVEDAASHSVEMGGGAFQDHDEALAEATDAPIHLGITEAGGLTSGTIKSAIGLGNLLWMGIGDTIRVSLSADPVEEVKVGFEILKSLGLRHRGVNIISCPSCARQGFDVIKTVEVLEQRLEHIKTPMSLSIIGCVVNGPGEALMTDVGFTGGGAGNGMVYLAGKASHKMSNDQMVEHIVEEVEKKAAEIAAREAQAAE